MAKKQISCEIKKVFEPKGGKAGMSLAPSSDTAETVMDDIRSSHTWNNKYDNFTTNFFLNGKDLPEMFEQGKTINFTYYVNKGYINIDQDSDILEVKEMTLEELEDDLPKEDDSFDYGANVQEVKKPDINDAEQIRISKLVDRYNKILKTIDPNLDISKLDQASKKDIATHLSIILN